MRIPDQLIYPLILTPEDKPCAFEQMRRLYQTFKDPKLKFWVDFFDYSENGYVWITPTAMAFAKVCRDGQGDYWFVRAAVGPLLELLMLMPTFLPRVVWCRDNDGVLRIWKTERLYKIAAAQMNQSERQG